MDHMCSQGTPLIIKQDRPSSSNDDNLTSSMERNNVLSVILQRTVAIYNISRSLKNVKHQLIYDKLDFDDKINSF